MSQYCLCWILQGAHNGEKYGNFIEIAVLKQKLFLCLSEKKSIVIIAFTQVMNTIVTVLMGTGNKVYLNYGVAEGQNLKLKVIGFFCRILYWEI